MLFHYVHGTFSEDWVPLQNLMVAYAIIFLFYFSFQTAFQKASVVWLGAVGYMCYLTFVLNENQSHYRLAHFIILAITMECTPKLIRKMFSVSELFLFAMVNAYYTSFVLDSVIYHEQRKFISGCNITNSIIFSPWVLFNCVCFSLYLLHCLGFRNKPMILIVSSTFGIASFWVLMRPYNAFEIFSSILYSTFMKNIATIVYMGFILILGIFMIIEIEPYTPNLYVRKCFHFLAFVLFLIPIVNSLNEPPVLLVLAFNLVTLALIGLELFRFNGMLPLKVSKFFKHLSDGFER